MRRNDVASTSFRCRVPIRFLINQCQIITFLILKYDIIENSRIELRGIVLPVQMGGLLGGPKGMLAPPPLKLLGGGPGPPSSYAYESHVHVLSCSRESQMGKVPKISYFHVCRQLVLKNCPFLYSNPWTQAHSFDQSING